MSADALAVGIDFGGTSVKFGVCAGAEIIAGTAPIDTTAYYDHPPANLILAIADRVSELIRAYPSIRSVGAGIPGLVDFKRGHIHEITNVPGWIDIPFRDLLSAKVGLPVSVDNDANCMAYAEWKHGAGCGFDDLIAITLGTGVGGGLIIGGQLHRGAQFCAGEIGHTSIDHNRPPTAGGMPGIIEKFVGNRAIAARAKQLYAEAAIDKPDADCTPRALAQAGCPVATQVWQEVADHLGIALANAVWLLNPQAIIIGGGIAKAGDVLFAPLQKRLHQVLSPILAKNLRLIPAKFGNEAGIIGSAAQAAAR